MIRVLHIFHEMANGGIEHFVMDYYRHIDRSKIQFDFLMSVEHKGFFDDEIQTLGGKVYYAYPFKKNPIRNYYSISKIVNTNNYNIIHRHTGSAFGYFDLRAAKNGGAKTLILHSHNNQAGNNFLHKLSKLLLKCPCEQLACSHEAGKWLFGENSNYKIINNSINTSKFKFNDEIRNQIRKEFDLQNKYVIGHVGRFEEQKNHEKLFDLFTEIKKHKKDVSLVCIGTGKDLDKFKLFAKNNSIINDVKFLENRNDVNLLMNAFDVFVLPSKYEGFPFVLLEAQANGLHCVVSSNVPAECNITGNITFINLNRSTEEWISAILSDSNIERDKLSEKIRLLGYDIYENSNKLYEYYVKVSSVM